MRSFSAALDMTDEMLAPGVQNVKFLKGEIENIPLPDNSVDVIISNCVINLSVDKVGCCVRRSAFSCRVAVWPYLM